jgi:hypothetical protein
MTQSLIRFKRNFGYSKNLLTLSATVDALTTDVVDVSDMNRAALVAGVSALDAYVHSVVRELMIEISIGRRATTDAFKKFAVPMSAVDQAAHLPSSVWLDAVVADRHSHLSFQQPDKIADAIRLVSGVELWNEIGTVLGQDPKTLKVRQKLLIDRRNQIVHEADSLPTPPYERRQITYAETHDALDFTEELVFTIDGLL